MCCVRARGAKPVLTQGAPCPREGAGAVADVAVEQNQDYKLFPPPTFQSTVLSTTLGFWAGFFFPLTLTLASIPGENQGMEMEGMNLFQKRLPWWEVQPVTAGI